MSFYDTSDWQYPDDSKFSELLGKTITEVEYCKDFDQLRLKTDCGKTYITLHHQDCCESVTLVDGLKDMNLILNEPILLAEESTKKGGDTDMCDSWTWTFYKLQTNSGAATMRWVGESNGYCGEEVSFFELKESNDDD